MDNKELEIVWFDVGELDYSVGTADEWELNERTLKEGTCVNESLRFLQVDVAANGLVNPLIITEEKKVLIGNQRLCVARSLGIERVACVVTVREHGYEAKVATHKPTEYNKRF